MKFIKLGLISFIFLFLLMTAISLLLPSTINISRATDLNGPFDSAYSNINNLARWKDWYANYDASTVSFSAKTEGAGAMIRMNNTTVTIVENTGETIKTDWRSGSKRLQGEFNFYRQNESSQFTVQWHFVQHVQWYPWQKFASIVTDKTIGPVMEKSLDNLKKLVEK